MVQNAGHRLKIGLKMERVKWKLALNFLLLGHIFR